MASAVTSERGQVVQWFETDFKETAKATTRTSRLEDGRLSYRFSVVNNSGLDFSKFSFKVRILNKTNGGEIGTATINAGAWARGEKKNFRSKITIPQDVKSISFVMYSESLDYETKPVENFGEALREIGEMVSGSDGSGGVFGELFGTGGMPQTTVTKTTTTRNADGTTTKTTTTTTRSGSGTRTTTGQTQSRTAGTVPARTAQASYAKRKTDKKLNKMRLGKSGGAVTSLVFACLFAMAALGTSPRYDLEEMIAYWCLAGILGITALVLKLTASSRGKRIRAYEAKVNRKGNTSLDELSEYVKRPVNKVADDLQKMIVDGFFPEAYVDINNRLLVMTKNGEPIESVEKSSALSKKARRKSGKGKDLAPESLDDLIAVTDDTQIKSKLRTLRTVTRKIDQRVEEVPDLESQVKEFREKYYPEVVRLTDDYNEKIASLDTPEKQTDEQKDIVTINANPNYLQEQAREIKEQLIKLIDSVTEASENLLEKLHEDDIMDITTDIKMLQTTLASKGLLDSDFDL